MAFSASAEIFHAAAVRQFSTVWALSQWKQIYFILNILIYFVAICLDSSLTVLASNR